MRNFAEQHNQKGLVDSADRYILDCFQSLMVSEKFADIPLDVLLLCISSDYLFVDDEVQVYEGNTPVYNAGAQLFKQCLFELCVIFW